MRIIKLPLILKLRPDRLLNLLMRGKGVTLVEILLVVALSSLFMVAIIPFMRSVNDSWSAGSSKTEILQTGRGALEMLTRYIRQSPRITEIPGSSGDYIRLRSPGDASSIVFYHNVPSSKYYTVPSGIIKDGDLVMLDESSGSNSLFAPSVESFILSFYKDNGAAAAKANQVRSAKIQMELKDPQQISGNLNLESLVYTRQDTKIWTSLWVIDGRVTNNILRELSGDLEVSGFNISTSSGDCLAVNASDGTCWIADRNNNRIRKISASGEVLANLTGFSRPSGIAVNTEVLVNNKETVWVADTNGNRIRRVVWTGSAWSYTAGGGANITGFSSPVSVSVNTQVLVGGREVCWVADTNGNRIRRIVWTGSAWSYSAGGGMTLTGFSRPRSISVNSSEIVNSRETVWVADTNGNRIRRIVWTGSAWSYTAGGGTNIAGFSGPRSISANPGETINGRNSCWVADTGGNRVRKVYWTGSVWAYYTFGGFSSPYSVSVNPANSACWIADYGNNRVARLNADGEEEFDIALSGAVAVSTNPD